MRAQELLADLNRGDQWSKQIENQTIIKDVMGKNVLECPHALVPLCPMSQLVKLLLPDVFNCYRSSKCRDLNCQKTNNSKQ